MVGFENTPIVSLKSQLYFFPKQENSPFAKAHEMCVFNSEQTKNSVFNSYIIHSEVNC